VVSDEDDVPAGSDGAGVRGKLQRPSERLANESAAGDRAATSGPPAPEGASQGAADPPGETTRGEDHDSGAAELVDRASSSGSLPPSAEVGATPGAAGTTGATDGGLSATAAGIGGSQYVSLGHTAARHVKLIAVVTVIGLVCGVGAAFLRPARYTAEARIVVGTNATLANVQASAGLPAAEDSFAAEYARLITSSTVMSEVASRLHEASLHGSLSASPIPQSPIIRVDANASSPNAAARLAEVGAEELISAVDKLNTGTAATVQGLLAKYEQVEGALGIEQAQIKALQARLDVTPSGSPTVRSLRGRLAAAQGAADVDQLEATALSNQYQNQYSPYQQEEQTVKLTGAATSTGSDRKKALEIGVLGGLIGGLVVGLAAAAAGDLRQPATRE